MKEKSIFECTVCKKRYVKWQGSCFHCGSFNEIIEKEERSDIRRKNPSSSKVLVMEDVMIEARHDRIQSGILELDRVLGGGVVPHSVILLSGNPGIGKSTLLLHLVCALSDLNKILYIATEEDEAQIKLRLLRLHNKKFNWFIVQETQFESMLGLIEEHTPQIVIIDSLQNISINNDMLGNQIQKIKIVTQKLVEDAKRRKYTLIFTGHVTKEGEIAGPKTVEHLVDTVLYFDAESHTNLRILRSTKNRFGPIDEIGFFTMTEQGIVECVNPQEIFIENTEPVIGAALTWVKEGSREFLVEIETLLVPSKSHTPQRIVQGSEHKQFLLLCAIIEKYLHIPLSEFDIFSKIRGNFKTKETHIDLAVVMSILSSYFHKVTKKKILYSGEINLSGNVTARTGLPKKIPFNKYGIESIIAGKMHTVDEREVPLKIIESVYELKKIFEI
ncbi:MAG: DNA repair protein RadA [Neisseriales bacterium]|nr:MAG: DNA repair protein RadA [Neisseriales bacterium]